MTSLEEEEEGEEEEEEISMLNIRMSRTPIEGSPVPGCLTPRRAHLGWTGLSVRVTGSFPGSFFNAVHRGILPLASQGTLRRLFKVGTLSYNWSTIGGRGGNFS